MKVGNFRRVIRTLCRAPGLLLGISPFLSTVYCDLNTDEMELPVALLWNPVFPYDS